LVEVKGTLDELRELFAREFVKETKRQVRKAGTKAAKKTATGVKRKLSAWQRYMKQKKNQIKFKSGDRKGMLNLKAMARKFKRGKKK